MSAYLSRRKFVQEVGAGVAGATAAAMVSARGREALAGSWIEESLPSEYAGEIILSSNENPLGPPKAVLGAVRGALGAEGLPAGRYPFGLFFGMKQPLAGKLRVKPDNLFVGLGSTQILTNATELLCSRDRHLVSPVPTYEECAGHAERLGPPIKTVSLDAGQRIDLDAVVDASKGAGLVYYSNPNNPTATLHSASDSTQFIHDVLQRSPDTTVLVDEAYHDYVTDPSHGTLMALAAENPRVIVTRTFSKAYGMAGLRIGYAVAHPDTIKKLNAWNGFELFPSLLAMKGLLAALGQDADIEKESARNQKVRDYTGEFFRGAGYELTESQTNFIFVNVRRPIKEFQAACKEKGVLVGRPFEPLTSYARISMGTMEEMKQATKVFAEVLGAKAKTAA